LPACLCQDSRDPLVGHLLDEALQLVPLRAHTLRVLAGPWVGLVPGPVESLAESARPSVQGPECAQKRQVVPRPRHPCPPTRQWTHLSP